LIVQTGKRKKCLQIASNLAATRRSSKFNGKQKLQNLVLPEEIKYDKGNKTVQTPRTNSLLL
jgi:hypothetical protein